MQIEVQGPTYFSQNDETAMFEWLGRISSVRDFRGEGQHLVIRLKRAPGDAQLRDLIALFHRYQMDMTPLAAFRTERNESWFFEPSSFWFDRVFQRS